MKVFITKLLVCGALFFCLPNVGISQCYHTQTSTSTPYVCSVSPVTFTNHYVSSCFTAGDYCEWHIKDLSDLTVTTVVQNNNNDLVYLFPRGGTYEVKFYVKDSNGTIKAWPYSMSGTAVAIVNIYDASDAAQFTIDDFSCDDGRIVITPKAGFSSTYWQIDMGDGTTYTYNNADDIPVPFSIHTYTKPYNTTYYITVTAEVTQGGEPCGQGTHTFTLPFNPPSPNVTLEFSEANCFGQEVCIATDDEDIQSIAWYDGDVLIHGPGLDPCYYFTQSGTYSVVVTGANGCSGTFPIPISLQPATAGVLYSPDAFITPGQPFELHLNNSSGNYVVYEVNIAGCVSNPTWVAFDWGDMAQMANYQVPVSVVNTLQPCMLNENFEFCFRARVYCEQPEDNYGPGSVSTNEVCFPVCASGEPIEGLAGEETPPASELHITHEDVQHSEALEVFPNPTADMLYIELDHIQHAGRYTIDIIDVNGQKLDTKMQELGEGFYTGSMDVGNLPAGVYILSISGSQMKKTSMFIKK